MSNAQTLNQIRVNINSHLGQTKAENVNWEWIIEQAASAIDPAETSQTILDAVLQLQTAIAQTNEQELVDTDSLNAKRLFETLRKGDATFIVSGLTSEKDIKEWADASQTFADNISIKAFGFDNQIDYETFLQDVGYYAKEISILAN